MLQGVGYKYILKMKYRKKLWQKRVGHLLVFLLLIGQTTSLWAGMTPLAPVQQGMMQDCPQQMMAATVTVKQTACLENCQHAKHCSNTCNMQCTLTAPNMMPASRFTLIPSYYLNSISHIQTSPPVGRGLDVLDRPPRQFT
ncbi:MAG: hypothetical protein P8047_15030 [Gammaproteobacteria bacterium]